MPSCCLLESPACWQKLRNLIFPVVKSPSFKLIKSCLAECSVSCGPETAGRLWGTTIRATVCVWRILTPCSGLIFAFGQTLDHFTFSAHYNSHSQLMVGDWFPHLRHFVLFEDECDASTAVVKVTTVGLTLGMQRSRGVRRRTHAPLVAGRREAGEELVLDTLVTSGARRRLCVGGWEGFGKEAGPTTTPHLEERGLSEKLANSDEQKV